MPKVRAVVVRNAEAGLGFAEKHGYPILVKSAFSLQWSATAEDSGELVRLVEEGLRLSPIGEVSVEKAQAA